MQATLLQPLARRLANVAAADAAVSRLCFDRRFATALLQPGWGRSGAQPPEAADPAVYAVEFGSQSAQLTLLVPEALDLAATTVVGSVGWSQEMRRACLEVILEERMGSVLAWARQMGMRLTAVLDAHELSARSVAKPSITWQIGTHRVGATLLCSDAAWLDRANEQLLRVPATLTTVANVRVPAAMAFGWRRIRVAALRAMRVGDVLLASRNDRPGSVEHARLRFGGQGRQSITRVCRFERQRITIIGEHWMSGNTSIAAPARESGTDPLAELEVDLHLELKVLGVPMGDLASMRVGYIMELPVAAEDATVDLVVSGQPFGRAQLVCIGDRLGARIVALNHGRD